MGGAMAERLREQNQHWDKKEETDQSKTKKPRTPWIKVTIVKMLAQILQNNLFINTSSSCDILINPTPVIANTTKTIKANRDLVNSKPGKHWLAQLDIQGVDAFKFGLWGSVLALQKPNHEIRSNLEEGKRITNRTLENFLLDTVELLLQKGEYDLIERIVLRLCEDRFQSRQCWDSWRDNCYPLVERFILKTDEVDDRITMTLRV
ncbi:hypothetical protein N0V84_008755 [Fusarium piperis]|uniref:Uncharacterized protein n=1 Tax=Fusarium piperis TaxID=1435070 RepID=A0A9W8W7J1_9HYPO|nr:hypothetical protein N0V84_008755 [Fusarium piperis]